MIEDYVKAFVKQLELEGISCESDGANPLRRRASVFKFVWEKDNLKEINGSDE